ncbi:MAG: AsmA family protein [Gammaproteobacteria bacterium]|nr:AsmA family protein [Gammaproteobacteria bacterium]
MGKLLKVLGIVIGALVVLFVAVVVGITLLVDPNDYKDQIAAAVGDATGRELTLEGDLELDVFPSLRISLGQATLSNAEGFGDQPFAEIGAAALDLELLPLLSRRIEIAEATLEGLVLNLARDAQGRNNWQDLGGAGAAAEEPAPAEAGGGAPNVALDVAVLRIADSEVNWADASTDSRWTLGNFNLLASDFGPDVAFPVEMSFTLAGEELDVAVSAATNATLSLADNRYRLDELGVTLEGSGAAWPGGEGEARLEFASFVADLNQETLELDGLTLEALGVTVNGSLEGRQLMSDLALGGRVDIQQFDPSQLLGVFDVQVDTADPSVLRSASAEATFVYDSSRTALEEMRLALDDSTLTGSVGMQGESLRFDLRVDQINVDRYLPPAEEEAPAEGEEGSLDEVDLPLDVLRTLDADGSLAFGEAQFAGLTLSDAAFSLAARDGRVQLKPSAQLYGGEFSGDIVVEVVEDAARATVVQQISGVDMLPLGRDLLESEMVSGTGSVMLDLTTAGSNVGQMRRDLDGDVSFEVTDGALEGLDLWYELLRARAVFDGESPPERPEGPRRTPFTSVSASGVVEDALLSNRDLNVTLDYLRLDGEGTVNLLNDALDFDLTATFVDSPKLQSEPLMAGLAGDMLPLEVGGTIAAPEVKPDYAALVRARAQEAVTERVDEERQEVEQRVEQESEEAREEIRDRVRDRLRNIFD